MNGGTLVAVSDLHVEHEANRKAVEALYPASDEDWLLVAGDVANGPERLAWALGLLRDRFAKVVWVPGNHELHTYKDDPLQLRGEDRYLHLVALCQSLGVITPEDPYPTWNGPQGPVRIVPMFLLYDYTFGLRIHATRAGALRRAYEAGVVCDDEFLLQPDPYPTRAAWCEARVRSTMRRLEGCSPTLPAVLVNHFPLRIEPTQSLIRPEFAQWCGTTLTADWHQRFRAVAVVYGHLHIPRTSWHDGVPFEEVSLGNPRGRLDPSRCINLRAVLPR